MPSDKKRLGFVDYRLDNFHANTFLTLLRGPLKHRGYVVAGATAVSREPNAAWARAHDVPYFDSAGELNEYVDGFMVLAPSDPQLHLAMCEQVFPFQKTTFVDKTFAPDSPTAARIYDLADRHGTAVQSTSVLRYTSVQEIVEAMDQQVQNIYVWSGGTSVEEYLIHPVELVVSCLGADATEIMRLGDDSHPLFVLKFSAGRVAVIDFTVGVDVPYAAAITTPQSTQFESVDMSQLFFNGLSAMLDFFDAAAPQIDRAETLLVRTILDAATLPPERNRFLPLIPGELPRPHARKFQRATERSSILDGRA